MNVLSLFDGISAARVALDRIDVKINHYFASEIKPHAIKIAQAMFPDTIQLGDITKIDFSILPPIDIIVFGSPCQDLSIANKERRGLGGNRSELFYRAVEAIRVCRPRWFLMENVASMKPDERNKISLTLGEFHTNDLHDMCCEPIRINSSLVSAQMRDRLYWCNWNVYPPRDKSIILQDILEYGGEALNEKSYALLTSYGRQKEKDFTRGKGQLVKIGNIKSKHDSIWSRVYSPNGKSVNLNANGGGSGTKTGLYKIGENVRRLTPRECCRLQTYDERVFNLFTLSRKEATPERPYMSKNSFYNVFGDSFTVDVISHILQCNKELLQLSSRSPI
jgi:site-specific DNA-cytosine methylase